MDNQLLLFALDNQTSDKLKEHISTLKENPNLTFSDCWEESANQKFQYLDVRTLDGKTTPNEVVFILQGAPSSINVSESPTTPIQSYLSDILQQDPVPTKYHLSRAACSGILHRAQKRGKELPEVLRITLENQVTSPITDKSTEICEDED